MKTLSELAGELYGELETRKRNDGKEFTCLKDGSPSWMTEVIRKTHGESFPDDTIYRFIEKAAGAIFNADADDEEAANESIYQIESDVYTSDLTAWLAERDDHVYYLTEALQEFGSNYDGFQILGLAQQQQIKEVGFALVSALVEYEASQSDEEEN